jgi:hypothetical protein
MRAIRLLPFVIALSWLGARDVHADGTELIMSVKPPDPKDPKQKDNAPSIAVTVINGPKLPAEKFSLSTTNAKLNQKVTISPPKLREYTEGTETLAIALVICGQMVWIGNKDYEQDTNAQYEGVLKNLESAIDKLQLGNAGPPGSKGVVISYSTGADIKVPMTELKSITGGALGAQKDYKDKIGTDLVSGITAGVAQLSNVMTARKALIVVGDGTDTNPEAAKQQLVTLKKQALQQNIQMFAVIYKSEVSGDAPTVITTMIPGAKTVNSVDGIASEMDGIIQRMKERYYLEFQGEKDEVYFPFDGKDHDMVLKIDQAEQEAVSLQLPPWEPPKGMSLWWLWIVIPVGALLLLIIAFAIFGKKEAPMPMPMPMPVAAAPAPEAPKAAVPMKTVMMNADGSSDGFPVVGWIVPLNGQNAYQTFKLRGSGTRIGTQPPADIVVNDGFMSTDHCQIACSPQGFVLIDNGATNGCYVNDKKVQRHELVDNDLITLGKTNFKFKSIN